MDRSCASEPEHSTAMRTAGSAAFELLLSAAAGERSKSGSAPPTRSVVFEAPLLRQPQNGCRTGSEPQAHPAPDAYPGHRSPLSQTKFKSPGAGASSLSVPAAWRGNPPAQPRLEHRYYLRSDAWRLSLSSGSDGVVQPLRAQLGTLQHYGEQFLPGCARGRLSLRSTRNLELRSGLAIHLRRISVSTPGAWHPHQYGRPWSSPRQRFYRTAVALAQVRTDLPRRLRQRPRSVPGLAKLFPLLQLSTPASGAGLSNPGRSIPAQIQKEEVTFLMRALPSNSRDLTLFFPEWMFLLYGNAPIAVHSKCLLGGQGSAGTRPEHRCKSG